MLLTASDFIIKAATPGRGEGPYKYNTVPYGDWIKFEIFTEDGINIRESQISETTPEIRKMMSVENPYRT
jgi:hypothetical protein